jgi:predicted secreted protein
MAHSTRKKEKKARGGLTKNQALKAGRAARQAERYRQVMADNKAREEAQRQAGPEKVTIVKRRTYSMKLSAQLRRKTVFDRLTAQQVAEVQAELPLNPRVTRELNILSARMDAIVA